jgi:multisubunit Na+/H+ antiporter MnhB subunit
VLEDVAAERAHAAKSRRTGGIRRALLKLCGCGPARPEHDPCEQSYPLTRPDPSGSPQQRRDMLAKLLPKDGAKATFDDFDDLVRLKYWMTLDSTGAAEWRSIGDEYYLRAEKAFTANSKVKGISIFARSGLGVYRTADALRWSIIGAAIRFDWSEAYLLFKRVDIVAETAMEWWGSGRSKDLAELGRQLERTYGVATTILQAIDRENPEDGCPSSDQRSAGYRAALRMIEPQVAQAEAALQHALQRSAQTEYGKGMVVGAMVVLALCAGLAIAFAVHDVPAWEGVAFPAGAVGAVVSVLQRMTTGSLRLDFTAGKRMLLYYGAVRPLIGGVLGYTIFVLLTGDLFPAISISETDPLATYAGLGFLGGFNERWAQDALAGSAKRLQAASPPSGISEPS